MTCSSCLHMYIRQGTVIHVTILLMSIPRTLLCTLLKGAAPFMFINESLVTICVHHKKMWVLAGKPIQHGEPLLLPGWWTSITSEVHCHAYCLMDATAKSNCQYCQRLISDSIKHLTHKSFLTQLDTFPVEIHLQINYQILEENVERFPKSNHQDPYSISPTSHFSHSRWHLSCWTIIIKPIAPVSPPLVVDHKYTISYYWYFSTKLQTCLA